MAKKKNIEVFTLTPAERMRRRAKVEKKSGKSPKRISGSGDQRAKE